MKSDAAFQKLFDKYDKPAPRYTSFPSYPYWEKQFGENRWKTALTQAVNTVKKKQFSLYLHMPFCESLCHFCGCNKIITKNHDVEQPYLDLLLKEWNLYRPSIPADFELKEMHLGGGTPTFLSPKNLETFFQKLFSTIKIAESPDFSIEAHPGVTTAEHLDVLRRFSFNRLSLGVQDFNPKIQKAVNRIQTFEDITFCTEYARKIGFSSINFDLIYGLPYQTQETMAETIKTVSTFAPERIAFYSYAHIPSSRPGQKKMDAARLQGYEKYQLYLTGKKIFLENNYCELGFDHFAKPTDDLAKAFFDKSLHRNFMGFTVQNTPLLIGLGVSSISDAGIAYGQNHKSLQQYRQAIEKNRLDIQNGTLLSDEDIKLKQIIKNLACFRESEVDWNDISVKNKDIIQSSLKTLEEDAMISVSEQKIKLTEKGMPFLRIVCAAWDPYFTLSQSGGHSQSV